ncbi:MAG: phosphohistidine phosphatase SixA [Candidatus Kapaibacterium sp.]
MLLYLIRHGDADTPAESDDDRVLSKKGIRVTIAMAQLLKRAEFEPPEIIITSPLPRAEQTARIMAEEFAPKAKFEINPGLRPGSSLEAGMSIIASKKDSCKVLMLAGHDPLFSKLASVLVSGSEQAIEMKKSAVALFELTRFEVPGMRGILRAYLPPKIV